MINPAKKYTWKGFPCRILCTDLNNGIPIALAVSGMLGVNGETLEYATESDLVEVKPVIERWLNVYRSCRPDKYMVSETYRSKTEAYTASNDRLACIQIKFSEGDGLEPKPAVEREWTWPESLDKQWIAMDENGSWWCYGDEPTIDDGNAWNGFCAFPLSKNEFAFTPPPCTDWRQSKRKNPRLK